MTLIIKELIIRGIVQGQREEWTDTAIDKEEIKRCLEEMKDEIEQKCFESVMQKLASENIR